MRGPHSLPFRALLALLAAMPGLSTGQEPGPARVDGERLFDSYCSACHQYDDQGMGEAPPLEDSPWVVGPAERLIRIILHGVEGRIEVNGVTYDREMPGFEGMLTDRQAAALATYARTRFGAPDPSVAAEDIARVRAAHAGRKGYWPAAELLEIR